MTLDNNLELTNLPEQSTEDEKDLEAPGRHRHPPTNAKTLEPPARPSGLSKLASSLPLPETSLSHMLVPIAIGILLCVYAQISAMGMLDRKKAITFGRSAKMSFINTLTLGTYGMWGWVSV